MLKTLSKIIINIHDKQSTKSAIIVKILAFDSVFSYHTIIETKHIKGTHYGKQHHEHRKQYQHFDTA